MVDPLSDAPPVAAAVAPEAAALAPAAQLDAPAAPDDVLAAAADASDESDMTIPATKAVEAGGGLLRRQGCTVQFPYFQLKFSKVQKFKSTHLMC